MSALPRAYKAVPTVSESCHLAWAVGADRWLLAWEILRHRAATTLDVDYAHDVVVWRWGISYDDALSTATDSTATDAERDSAERDLGEMRITIADADAWEAMCDDYDTHADTSAREPLRARTQPHGETT